MLEKDQLKAHVILPAELRDNVLILTPEGESIGYRDSVVSAEMKHLQKAVEADEVRHLLIDASQANYFGSAIIGLLNSLALRII